MIRLFSFLLFSSGLSAELRTSSEMFGSLQSPNFPETYPPDQDLRWNISVPQGFQVRLYFSHFHLEPSYLCEYDSVQVETEGQVLARFCGTEDTDTEAVPADRVLRSPRNSLSVRFCSDFSNEERYSGFLAHYSAVDVDECRDTSDDQLCDHYCHNYVGGYYCSCRHGYQLHPDNRTCTVECSGGVFRDRSGVLSSPDFPAPYPKSSSCSYLIQVEDGFRLRLQFDPRFDVEDHPEARCPYDYVQIETGSGGFGPFCGNQSPGVVETDSNVVAIRFHSDGSGENLGWRLVYTATGSQCPVLEAPLNAVMNPVQSEYSFKDHVVFTCAPGYHLVQDGEVLDHIQLDCLAHGSWSRRPPSCQLVDCGMPKEADMAEVVFGNHDNSTLLGATVVYVCREDGGQLSNTSFRCGPAGDWIDAEGGTGPPTCRSACGRPARPLPPQVKRVVGGRSSEPGFFPWQVLLSVEDRTRVPEDRWFGSGALLSDSWVLTAAHVLRSLRRDSSVVPVAPEHVQVFLGLLSIKDQQGSTSRTVNRILLHPDFQPSNYNNDVALLRLEEPLDFSPLVRPVCLPPPHRQGDPPSPPPNSLGVVAGWGISNPSSPPAATLPSDPVVAAADLGVTPDLLQFVKLPVVPQDECRASYATRSSAYNITNNMFCAGFREGGRDTCLGDSGGGFVVEDPVRRRWAVWGLVSWGGPEECGTPRMYGVYTRVDRFVDWILQHLG
ncbi:mannan-binding lectin serine protease 1 [Cololabis saira]|uniref:mannan-binding lectin serine protease 1 n=1 Tax=Cololabis saira TaxID=129043 RepID=UPI002AD57168|nr:mannan-binding lectin serine protease 1 [Cololabis saira]